jgi:hypothetical protein
MATREYTPAEAEKEAPQKRAASWHVADRFGDLLLLSWTPAPTGDIVAQVERAYRDAADL